MPVTHPVRKPDGQPLWAVRTKTCKRLNTSGTRRVAQGPQRARRARKSRPPGRLLPVSTDLPGNQAPTFSVPFMMAQWPGKEQKNA